MAGAAAALALLPISASAHARLLASSPLPGEVLESIPANLILDFSESVTAAGRGISVYGPDGRLANASGVRTQGSRMTVGLLPSEAQGTYAVLWTVVSEDTHPSRGEFTFDVGHASPVRAPGFGGDVGLASPVGLALQALSRWMHFIGFSLGFGVSTYALFTARDERPLRLATAGVILMLAGEPVSLLAQTASLDPSQTFDGDAITGALGSPFGRVLGLRLAAAFLLWALLGALRQAPWLRWGIPATGMALALVDATAAHPTPGLPPPLGLLLNGTHVAAMGIWLGGLAGFILAPAGGFARVAAWSAGLLVLSGAALALLHFAQPLELVSTPYGISLLVKLPLVAIALWLAWRARRRWELGVLTAVLLAAAVLVSLPPPR